MKENRFIELLNLYIDRQITAAETAELEAEIQSNPKRQAVYSQYCRIHSATKLVYESFRAVAAEQQPAAPAGRPGVVELFETRRRRRNWSYYAGGLAAAACLTLVFAHLNSDQPAASDVATQPQTAAVVATAPAAPVAVVAATPTEAAPTMAELSKAVITVPPDYAAMLTRMREQDEERAFHNERLQLTGMQPLFNDDLFEARRALSNPEQRVFRSEPATTAPQVEAAAFQFQR